MENALVRMFLPVPGYGAIANIPDKGPVPHNALDRLTHINCYMNDMISSVQGGTKQKHQVFDNNI